MGGREGERGKIEGERAGEGRERRRMKERHIII